jgi:hypothetical protein
MEVSLADVGVDTIACMDHSSSCGKHNNKDHGEHKGMDALVAKQAEEAKAVAERLQTLQNQLASASKKKKKVCYSYAF